jgi:aminomethyltransferase
MAIDYGSLLREHEAVRTRAGVFDVSHMRVLDIHGLEATAFLERLLTHNIGKIDFREHASEKQHKALYSCMLDEQGGVIDDLIVYARGVDQYRLVLNAGCAKKDRDWIEKHAQGYVVEYHWRSDLMILAIQGPQARDYTVPLLPKPLQTAVGQLLPFMSAEGADKANPEQEWFVARTGYTGEDGFEVIVSAEQGIALWQSLLEIGVHPCGLGARDTLRLEAGLHLYGQDMDASVSPLISGLAWTVTFDHEFIGRAALEAEQARGLKQQLVGLVLQEKGVLRRDQRVILPGCVEPGVITSGTFSPTLQCGIAMARIPCGPSAFPRTVTDNVGEWADQCQVIIRDQPVTAQIVKLPFVRKGIKACQPYKIRTIYPESGEKSYV